MKSPWEIRPQLAPTRVRVISSLIASLVSGGSDDHPNIFK